MPHSETSHLVPVRGRPRRTIRLIILAFAVVLATGCSNASDTVLNEGGAVQTDESDPGEDHSNEVAPKAVSLETSPESHLEPTSPEREAESVPDTQPGSAQYPWSMAKSAALHSQLAGLLAGFLFLCVTVLISRQPATGDQTDNIIYLVSTSFVVLLVASFMFGVVSGHSDASKALMLGTISAILLAIGAVATLAGLAWLVKHHSEESVIQPHIELLVLLAYVVASIHLSLTASDSIRGYSPATPLHWVFYFGSGVGVLVTAIAVVARRSERTRRAIVQTGDAMFKFVRPGVPAACHVMIAAVLVVVVLFSLISSLEVRPQWLTCLVASAGVVMFHIAAISILLAMPRSDRSRRP